MPPVKFKGKAGMAKKGTLKRLLSILFKNYKTSKINKSNSKKSY